MSNLALLHSHQHDACEESPDKTITSYNVCSETLSDLESADWDFSCGQDALLVGAATLARFWKKVNPAGPITVHRPELGCCWLWTANTVRGYGQFVLPRDLYGKQPHVYAHRFAYELTHGPLSSPVIKACHSCDNALCVRPSHLFPGTQADNLSDARRKGRLVDGAHLKKLSDSDIQIIRDSYRPRQNGKALAERFGVHPQTIRRVVAGTERVPQRSHGSDSVSVFV